MQNIYIAFAATDSGHTHNSWELAGAAVTLDFLAIHRRLPALPLLHLRPLPSPAHHPLLVAVAVGEAWPRTFSTAPLSTHHSYRGDGGGGGTSLNLYFHHQHSMPGPRSYPALAVGGGRSGTMSQPGAWMVPARSTMRNWGGA